MNILLEYISEEEKEAKAYVVKHEPEYTGKVRIALDHSLTLAHLSHHLFVYVAWLFHLIKKRRNKRTIVCDALQIKAKNSSYPT